MTTAFQAAPEVHSAESFDRDYWLSHCEGFRVDTADGRLGIVEEIRAGRGSAGDVLAVRTGLFGRHKVLVPTREVDFIVPRAERIWLHSPARIIGTEPAVQSGVAPTSRPRVG